MKHLSASEYRPPRLFALAYVIMALILVPWTIHLGASLPARHIAHHWDTLWVGYDCGLLAIMICSAYLLYRRSALMVISLSALSALLITDAWIDTITALPGRQFMISLLLAIVVELPLAIGVLIHATRVQIHLTRQNVSR